MNNAVKFAKLDCISVKPYLAAKNLAIFLVIFLVIGLSTAQPASLVGMIMMYGVIFSSYPFAVGDQNGIDTLYATLPAARKSVVAGRYIFVIGLNFVTGIFAIIFSTLMQWVLPEVTVDISLTVGSTLACFLLFSLIMLIQLPIYFRLGYTKAKFMAYLPLLLFAALAAMVWPE